MSKPQPQFDFRQYVKEFSQMSVEELMSKIESPESEMYGRHVEHCIEKGQEIIYRVFPDSKEIMFIVSCLQSAGIAGLTDEEIFLTSLLTSNEVFQRYFIGILYYMVGLSNVEELY